MNPMAHLDPMGSFMILFVGFGWAKPVPVDGRNLKNPRTDMMKVAAAGPISNLLLALVAGMVLRFLNGTGLLTETVFVLLLYFTRINITLAVFNMIPVAPLDGSQILSGLLINRKPQWVRQLQTHGPKVLFGAIVIGTVTSFSPISWLIRPAVKYLTLLFIGY